MHTEKWVAIEGYDNDYHISNNGHIQSIKDPNNPKLLKVSFTSTGERRVNLSKGGTSTVYDVGRLVAHHFCKSDGRSVECCRAIHLTNLHLVYKDDNYDNVNYSNLKWVILNQNMKMDSDKNGRYTEKVEFFGCDPYIEAAIKEHKQILCYVYNTYEKPKKCIQSFVIAYNHNNARCQGYVCTNGYSYKNAMPIVKRYKMKSSQSIVETLIQDGWNINNTGNWTKPDVPFIFTNGMFMHGGKDVIKKPDGEFYIVKVNQRIPSIFVEQR